MAVNTELDTLVLNIEVNDRKNGESAAKKISSLQRALTRFQSVLQNLDTKVFQTKFASMTASVKPFVAELGKAKNEILALDRLAKRFNVKKLKNISELGKIGEQKIETNINKDESIPKEIDGETKEFKNDSPDGDIDTLNSLISKYGELVRKIDDTDNKRTLFFQRYDGSNKITTKYTADLQEQDGKLKEIAGSFKYVGQTSSEVASGGLKSFFLSIKRIALYRAIRSALKWITASLKEGIGNVVTFDDNFRQTMSEITSSITVIKNSLGVIIMPLLQLVTPIIQGISKAIGNLANGVSYLTAKLKGESTWLKVNTDYLKEYNKQANKLNYDEFSVLSNTDETDGMFTQENISNVSGGILDDMRAAEVILGGIATILAGIAISKLATWIKNGGIKDLIDGLKGVKDKVENISSAGLIAASAFAFVTSIVNLIEVIKNWDSQSLVTKISAITAACLALAAVVFSILGAIPGLGHVAVFKGLAIGMTALASISGAISIMKFADGGMFEGTGTIYKQAGESGAEIVATGTRGTGVANVIQIEEAFYNALYKYNAAKQNQNNADVVINLDGKELARQQVKNTADALRQTYNLKLDPR